MPSDRKRIQKGKYPIQESRACFMLRIFHEIQDQTLKCSRQDSSFRSIGERIEQVPL